MYRADCFPNGEFRLPPSPLVSVQTVSYVDSDGNNQTLSSSAYEVITDEMPGFIRIANRLDRHYQRMDNARPHGKGYETSVLNWIVCRDDEEHAKNGIDTHDHLKVINTFAIR